MMVELSRCLDLPLMSRVFGGLTGEFSIIFAIKEETLATPAIAAIATTHQRSAAQP